MSKIGDEVLQGFLSEVEKLAFSPRASAILGNVGALGGAGLGLGAIGGAAHGAYRGYQQAKEQGLSTGQALGHGAAGALGGAGKGALIGGGVGAAAGLGAGALLSAPKAEALRKAVSDSPLAIGSQFGQRQVHGVTGWMPGAENQSIGQRLGQIGMGSSTRQDTINAAKNRIEAVAAQRLAHEQGLPAAPRQGFIGGVLDKMQGPRKTPAPKSSVLGRLRGRTAEEEAAKGFQNAVDSMEAARKAEEMGLTNIPGYFSQLKKDVSSGGAGLFGREGALRTAARSELSGNPVGTAFMVGVPAALAGKELLTPEDEEHPGSRLRRAGGEALQAATGLVMGPMPFVPQMALSSGLSSAGKFVGLPLQKKRRGVGIEAPSTMAPRAPDLTADSGQAVPGERFVSERAAGSLGEGSPT